MLYFPQLQTGALVQFPCAKRIVQRTVVNEAVDGGMLKLFDSGACTVEWTLALAGLASAEWNAISDLFNTVEGRLGSFTFLDPFDNLLKWSESLSAAAWGRDAGFALTDGRIDPFGGTGATRVVNRGAMEQRLSQTAAVASTFRYCLSAYVRSDDAAGAIVLSATSGAQTVSQQFSLNASWRRVEFGSQLTSTGDSVTFRVGLPAGTSADIFGIQAEPQAGASNYKKTTTHCGVYSRASFLDDALEMTSAFPGESSCCVRIQAKAS